jgi:type II secretory pathway predicted ATPase ExeA
MYENYWNLNRKPFDNTAERDFFFPAECHQGALLKLRYAVENQRGAALLSGGPGLGKTLLISRLFESLDDRYAPRVHVVFPKMATDQLVAFLGSELTGQAMSSGSLHEAIRETQHFLARNTDQGQHAVLVIDEAHLLQSRETLDTLRLLLNFQSAGAYDLTLLLLGQPQIITSVQRATGLDNRMTVKCLLRPLTETETVQYVNHRVAAAGGSTSLFSRDALTELFRQTQGVPGRINRLGDLALLIGFAEERQTIDAAQICEVAEEIVAIRDAEAA